MSMDVVHNCCSKQKVKRGLWSPEEDEKLMNHIQNCGHGSWSSIPKIAGLQRCGKSCRLRWINYLRPDLKRGSFSEQEERIIIDVHRVLGNRWAQIAKQMPGRTDNEVKNFWNSCIKKKLISQGLDPNTHVPLATISHESKTCSSSFHESSSSTTPTYVYQNPNLVWPDRFQEQTPKPLTGTFLVPTISSSSYHHSFPTELDIIIENCKNWGTGTTAITTEPTKMQLVQKQEEGCEVLQAETGTVFGYNGRQTNMDVGSFGSCNSLDFDFVESALVPCEMDYHLRSIMDQVAWHR